ncbi:sugar transferase [candidate division WOR-3 bacterium]|nr:sugar transferase [candidate division WOR-3 bacterium]
MLKEKLQVFFKISLTVDLIIILFSFLLAFYLRSLLPFPGEKMWEFGIVSWLLFIIVPVWGFLLIYERTYDILGSRNIYLTSFKAIVEGMGILFAVLFFRRAYIQSRLFLGFFGIINAIFILLSRRIGIHLLGEQSVFIIGTGEKAKMLYDFLIHYSPLKFKLIGTLKAGKRHSQIEDIEHTISSIPVDWVVSVIDDLNFNSKLVEFCRKIGIPASWAVPATDGRVDIECYGGVSFFTFSTAPKVSASLLVKYAIDRILAIFLLLLASPLFLIVFYLIKLDSNGKTFFVQERAGLNGRRFKFYKFRTMIEGAVAMQHNFSKLNIMGGKAFKIPNDPRVTRIGKLIRRASLDELPQLINVLRGEMSLVGPRPPLPSEIKRYEKWQRRKLSMKPGLTCIWQISGRNEIDFSQWMKLDLKYIDNWSLWLDFKILFLTIPAIIFGKGAY